MNTTFSFFRVLVRQVETEDHPFLIQDGIIQNEMVMSVVFFRPCFDFFHNCLILTKPGT